MSVWNIHLLNARHDLTRVLSEVRQASRDAVALASMHVSLPHCDLVIRAQSDRSAEGSVQGHSPAPGIIEIALTADRFESGTFSRALVRQMLHLIRWEGPGYGRSLGEVVVSEGLAGHFAQLVLGGQVESADTVRWAPGVARQAMHEWARRDFDHARWFHGKGDLRRWTGRSIGHRLVAEHLSQSPDLSAATLATAPAEPFRQILRRITSVEGQDPPETSSDD